MRHATALTLVMTAVLPACEPQQPAPAVDPAAGRACFETLRGSLPPGAQYEGIDSADGEHITIRIMNGIDVVTEDCRLTPDRSVQQ